MKRIYPTPPHGSEGRYKGTRSGSRPPCRCATCRRGQRLANVRRELVRMNEGGNLVDNAVLQAHLKTLTDSGMTQGAISRQSGVSQTTISYIVNGLTRGCQRDKADRLLALTPNTFDSISERPAVGAQRKMQALYAIGHGQLAISMVSGMNVATISHLVNGRYGKIDGRTDAKADLAYRKLAAAPGASKRAIGRAKKSHWAPAAAWDDDTIDDPAAVPNWTGHCGTDRGWWTHRQAGIPVCPACDKAHLAWKAERKHLPQRDLMIELGHARAAASGRGAAIAHDARELLAQGCDYDTAAARIGITRQHLTQELWRQRQEAA
ncbi:hypothetical protein OG875_05185 [Streptomyces sp. NBC_01498]|uniref:hypothetical protein n=1 Tax=Streptomyces sp. NBC_01498 TaxID=2975870 RepID=UPI002E7B81F8|nr:hypothetical protein [Streptomyces sp. NBC_01498]WTL24052.1 hypothetical protein OG875_05185 [Streptomyces sp. NBC_01498]